MSDHSVIIVAGGSGTRMNSTLPKQFLEISGKPVLVYTIEVFLSFDPGIEVIVVLPKTHFYFWDEIKDKFFRDQAIQTAEGGVTRFQSVLSGLEKVTRGLVAIHDAVRPCASIEVIRSSFESARKAGSGLVTVSSKDSIREITPAGSVARDRSLFRIVQTPQTFQTKLIREAFKQPEQSTFTDDATVFEAAGFTLSLVEGDYSNIKITTAEDLKIAEFFLKANL